MDGSGNDGWAPFRAGDGNRGDARIVYSCSVSGEWETFLATQGDETATGTETVARFLDSIADHVLINGDSPDILKIRETAELLARLLREAGDII
jgi:hypothetical protein